jgi:hypothetical protein
MGKLREDCKESLQPVVSCIISLTLMQHHQAKQCRNLEVLSVGSQEIWNGISQSFGTKQCISFIPNYKSLCFFLYIYFIMYLDIIYVQI